MMVVSSEIPFPASDSRGSSLEWLTEVFRHAASGAGLSEVVDTVWDRGREPLGLVQLAVGRFDASGELSWVRWWTDAGAVEPPSRRQPDPPLEDLVGRSSAPTLIDLADAGRRALRAWLGHASEGDVDARWIVACPMRAAGRCVGLMLGSSSRQAAPTDEELRTLELCAGRLAAVVDRERLDDSLRAAVSRLESTGRDLERLTMVDPLTGLANRPAMDAQLDLEWRRALRAGRPLSLLMVRIDDLEGYADAFGAGPADRCIHQVATELARGLRRAGDFSARTGETTFSVLLPGAAEHDAARAAERARAGVEGLRIPHGVGEPGPRCLTVSIGIATVVPDRFHGPNALRAAAEGALGDALSAGRNRIRWREVEPARPRAGRETSGGRWT
jgi:diguanylate cyclase (GGDEF)-like protein